MPRRQLQGGAPITVAQQCRRCACRQQVALHGHLVIKRGMVHGCRKMTVDCRGAGCCCEERRHAGCAAAICCGHLQACRKQWREAIGFGVGFALAPSSASTQSARPRTAAMNSGVLASVYPGTFGSAPAAKYACTVDLLLPSQAALHSRCCRASMWSLTLPVARLHHTCGQQRAGTSRCPREVGGLSGEGRRRGSRLAYGRTTIHACKLAPGGRSRASRAAVRRAARPARMPRSQNGPAD